MANAPSSRRLSIDWYLVLLLGMLALGLAAPAGGASQRVVDGIAYGAVAGLFFLYGARLSPSAVWRGLLQWRLQALVFASTFLLFPILGLVAGRVARPWLPADLALGLIFLTLLPSTVQSSIAFTSIARGNVAAALCSASVSNVLGVVLTPAGGGAMVLSDAVTASIAATSVGSPACAAFSLAVRSLMVAWSALRWVWRVWTWATARWATVSRFETASWTVADMVSSSFWIIGLSRGARACAIQVASCGEAWAVRVKRLMGEAPD